MTLSGNNLPQGDTRRSANTASTSIRKKPAMRENVMPTTAPRLETNNVLDAKRKRSAPWNTTQPTTTSRKSRPPTPWMTMHRKTNQSLSTQDDPNNTKAPGNTPTVTASKTNAQYQIRTNYIKLMARNKTNKSCFGLSRTPF